jgi:hypothetical protein
MARVDVSVTIASEDQRSFILAARLREGEDETLHEVTLARDLLARLAPDEPVVSFVRRCFAFLLERESKDSILRRFDVSVIAHYFPEFEKTITRDARP